MESSQMVKEADSDSNVNHDHEEKPERNAEVTKAISKVMKFSSMVFKGDIPPNIQGRIALLQDQRTIVADTNAMQDRLTEIGNITDTRKVMVAGFHDINLDKIFLKSDIDERTAIHEILHFLSFSDNDRDQSAGVTRPSIKGEVLSEDESAYAMASYYDRSNFDFTKTKSNEAITEILTTVIDKEIDVNSPNAYLILFKELENAKAKGELNSSGSYNDYIFNTLRFFWKKINTSKFLPDLARVYLNADKAAFENLLVERATIFTKKLRNNNIVNDYYSEIEKEGEEAKEHLLFLFENTVNRFNERSHIPDILKREMNHFLRVIQGKTQHEVEFTHPESDVTAFSPVTHPLIGISEPVVDSENGYHNPLIVKVDLTLINRVVPIHSEEGELHESLFTYSSELEAYLLWNSIQLKTIEDEGIEFDLQSGEYMDKNSREVEPLSRSDVLKHPQMQHYLSHLTPMELVKVINMFHATCFMKGIGEELRSEEIDQVLDVRKEKKIGRDDDFIKIPNNRYAMRTISTEEIARIPEEIKKRGIEQDSDMIMTNDYNYIPYVNKVDLELLH